MDSELHNMAKKIEKIKILLDFIEFGSSEIIT